jgi:hypothetical protein
VFSVALNTSAPPVLRSWGADRSQTAACLEALGPEFGMAERPGLAGDDSGPLATEPGLGRWLSD